MIKRRRTLTGRCTLLAALAGIQVAAWHGSSGTSTAQTPAPATREIPTFEVDPSWPKLPAGWVLGQVASAASDEQDHIWLLHRPGSVRADRKTGPPVMELDQDGNYLRGWGGPAEGYDWPQSEHGIFVDHKGYVWIGGQGDDDQILKFTKDGTFVMQLGHGGRPKTNRDTENFWRPADVFVYPPTNELFVADGYGNKRIIVLDADTGEYKRMWGAFGNVPMDEVPHRQAAPGVPTPTARSPRNSILATRPSTVQHDPRRESLERRSRLRRRSWWQARSSFHDRRKVLGADVDRPLVSRRGPGLRQRRDRRQRGLLRRPRAALSLCGEVIPELPAMNGASARTSPMNRPIRIVLPPWRAKYPSTCSKRSGVISTLRPCSRTNSRPAAGR